MRCSSLTLTLIAGISLLVASPTRATTGNNGNTSNLAALLASKSGHLLFVPSSFHLSGASQLFHDGEPDLKLIELGGAPHGSANAFAISAFCASDVVCNGAILGRGPGGRRSLLDALRFAYGPDTHYAAPIPPTATTPEPGTAALLGLGLLALAGARRREGRGR